MLSISPPECSRIAQDLQVRKVQVENVVQLLEEGNTVPFIARYRKERSGGLPEEAIRQVSVRVNFLRQLHDKKQTILKSIDHQGKLTDELRQAVLTADTLRRLDDLYLPYKPKKRSPATTARERGLEPLALALWHSDPAVGNLDELLPTLVNPEKELKTVDDVRTGVGQILTEMIAESADVRAPVRAALWELGQVASSKNERVPEAHGHEYREYFQFSESARRIAPHRIQALNRGEREGVLQMRLDYPKDKIQEIALGALAELLLKKAGQTPPAPIAPVAPPPVEAAPSSSETPPPAAVVEPAAAPTSPEGTASAAVEAAAAPPAAEVPAPAAVPEAPAPAAESLPLPSPPEAAPLVAAMETKPPLTLTGEPLAPTMEFRTPHVALFKTVLTDALDRLLLPSLEREIRRELNDEAESHAVAAFARNLRSLLLQPPLQNKRVLAIDPGYRTSCKVAALDERGNLLDHAVIHPFTPPPRRSREKPAPPVPTPAAVAPAAAPTEANPAAAPTDEAAPMAQAADAIAAAVTVPTVESTPPPAAEAAPSAPLEPAPAAAPVVTAPPPAPAAPPVDKKAEAKTHLKDLLVKHQISLIALGNGAGCRETEDLIAEIIASDLPDLAYVIVNETGASGYAVSQIGREEFPIFDATLRTVIAIGRRLLDPLSEFVKVDPQNIAVGLHQHDLGRRELKETLAGVVESCVNHAGVDVNTAGASLLRYIAGFNPMAARELVDWRKQNGPITSREQLQQMPGLGQQRWNQAVGFMKVTGGANPLDRTWIHPESYGLAERILAELGATPSALNDPAAHQELCPKLTAVNVEEAARSLGAGAPTVYDVIQELLKPGSDAREDMPPPIFKKGILRIEDLQVGTELKGTVQNVVDFGAFVDVGLKDSGLVHISQMANRYIKSPYEVVAVNDVVSVWVLTVDKDKHRVSLTMIPPGTDRQPQERRPRREEGGRPPRGRSFGGPPPGQGGTPDQAGSQAPRQGGPPDQGRGPRPPRGRQQGRGYGRPPQGAAREGGGPSGPGQGAPPPQQRPPLPPRKPRREPPKPKLTQEAIEGKVPLRTFSELSALFAAKKEKDTPPPAPPPAVAAAPMTPPETQSPAVPAEVQPHVAEPTAPAASSDARPQDVPPPAAEAPPQPSENP